MGEIADMMLDGTLCHWCGVFIDDEIPGYPRACPHCEAEQQREQRSQKRGKPAKTNNRQTNRRKK